MQQMRGSKMNATDCENLIDVVISAFYARHPAIKVAIDRDIVTHGAVSDDTWKKVMAAFSDDSVTRALPETKKTL
jgi:hypothetical protein